MKTVKVLFFNLALLFVFLLLTEGILWCLYPDYQFYYRTHPAQPDLEQVAAKVDTNWLQKHSTLGWVCQNKSNLVFPSPPRAPIPYQINAQGFRSAYDFDEPPVKTKKRILLIGDSFTFSIYLSEASTLSRQLQQLKGDNYEFYTLAIPAWGLDQMYLAYQEYIERLQPDQVVLSFIDDDLMRALEIVYHGCGRKPALKVEKDRLVENEDNPHFWEYLCWNNQIGNRILRMYYQRKAATLAQMILTKIIEKEQAFSRDPLFVRIPALLDLERKIPREIFSMQDLMQEKEVNYVELYDSLSSKTINEARSYYITDDGHFNEKGNQFLARVIVKYID